MFFIYLYIYKLIKLHVRGGCREFAAAERVINRVSQFYSVVGIVQIILLWLLSGVIEVNTATKFRCILPLPPK